MSLKKSFLIAKELLKTAPNGQWTLEKAWVKDEAESTPAKNLRSASPTMGEAFHPTKSNYSNSNKVLQTKNKIALDDMMDLVGKGGIDPQHFYDHIKKAPKGSIDFGHIFDKVKGNPNLKPLLGSSDFIDGLNHHLDGVRDLKDIHDHHGGVDAVEGILKHYHGAHGTPSEYSLLNFGKHNKKIHAEAQDLVNPGKGNIEYEPQPLPQSSTQPPLNQQPASLDPKDRPDYSSHIDPELDAHAESTFDNAFYGNDDVDDDDDDDVDPDEMADRRWKMHGKAAINRAMDAFKKYHKL